LSEDDVGDLAGEEVFFFLRPLVGVDRAAGFLPPVLPGVPPSGARGGDLDLEAFFFRRDFEPSISFSSSMLFSF